MRRMEGKSVVITGAARGIGKATAKLLLSEGAKVVMADINRDGLCATAKELAEFGDAVFPFVCDVSKREDNEKMLEIAAETFGKLDVLVNNAAVIDDLSPVGELKDEIYERVMAVNVYGPVCSMRKAVQIFKEQKTKGTIINIATVGAIRASGGTIYSASKAALLSLTRNTAYMYQSDGIRCNAILPGGMAMEPGQTGYYAPNMKAFEKVKPFVELLPNPVENRDVAEAVLFLAGDAAKSINGIELVVDCGWTTL